MGMTWRAARIARQPFPCAGEIQGNLCILCWGPSCAGDTYKDAHAWALAAEGYMTTTQWNYFDENGQYRPDAESALRLIRRVLEADPQNALAHHLHIHIAETARQTRCANSGSGQ